MQFLERTLEDILYNAPYDQITSRGLVEYDHDYVMRQVRLGNYGIADLVGITISTLRGSQERQRIIHITIYELKLEKINYAALGQGYRYLTALKSFKEIAFKDFNLKNTRIKYSVVLVGECIDMSGDFVYVADNIPNLSVYTYSYSFDGIKFSNKFGFHLAEENILKNGSPLNKAIENIYRQQRSRFFDEPF